MNCSNLLELRGQRFDPVAEFAVVDQYGQLVGLVNFEDLLAGPDDTPLAAIMDPSPPVVIPGIHQEVGDLAGDPSPRDEPGRRGRPAAISGDHHAAVHLRSSSLEA